MKPTPTLMFQGTGSDVGKSVLVSGLCRALTRRGLRVLPFKPQNMSNNAAVAIEGGEGGEIGRAQALQALACRVPSSVHMNPVLLKPESDHRAQVIVRGRAYGHLEARDFLEGRGSLMKVVLESFAELKQRADIVLVEGAGSASEVNLRSRDIANMGFAQAARVPVVLIGDIDRGGVIASLVGTHTVLDEADRSLVRGFIINRLRGEPRLFDAGVEAIVRHTGWPSFGVLPWVHACAALPAEDAVVLERDRPSAAQGEKLRIAIPMFSRISNFDDFDPLIAEPDVDLVMVPKGKPLPGDAHLIILPGTKSTLADLRLMREQGWDIDLAAHVRRNGHVIGICGGYQMLGRTVADPGGIEGPRERLAGLGLLQVETTLTSQKLVRETHARELDSGEPVRGYEIHCGQTLGPDAARPWFSLADGEPEGAVDLSGRVRGCYLHGLFANDALRARLLRNLGFRSQELGFDARVDHALNELAAVIEDELDVDGMLKIAARGIE